MKKVFQIAIVSVFILIALKIYQRESQISSWPFIEGIVVSTEIGQSTQAKTKKNRNGEKRTVHERVYDLVVNYQFEVDGRSYNGHYTADSDDDLRDIQRMANRYSRGQKLTVKYNPDDPSDSVVRDIN